MTTQTLVHGSEAEPWEHKAHRPAVLPPSPTGGDHDHTDSGAG